MEKQVVRARDFYRCPVSKQLSEFVSDDNEGKVLYRAIKTMCRLLSEGKTADEVLKRMDEEIVFDRSWFAYHWQPRVARETAVMRFRRFLDWLGDVTVLHAQMPVEVETANAVVKTVVDLVTIDEHGNFHAYILNAGKAAKSMRGQSVTTTATKDLHCLVAKAALEMSYPKIKVHLVYLANPEDKKPWEGGITPFVEAKTKKSNVFSMMFEDFYEDGIFDDVAILTEIDSVLSEKPDPPCFTCRNKDFCNPQTVKDMNKTPISAMKQTETVYVLPDYTPTQKEVVEHKDGPLLVCAGPGSGKTATLVGRIRRLIEKGVAPEFILAITFTRKAAQELKDRCASFVREYEMPEILTLNALGYKILRDCDEAVGECRLLTMSEQVHLIDTLLGAFDPIAGLPYGVRGGANGLFKTVARHLDGVWKEGKAYVEKHPNLEEDFLPFAESYFKAIEARGFISYDEQISKCVALFTEHPELLEVYQKRYQYIMVDEFQDVDESQAKLVDMLASAHRNLVVVGDDDQNIYGFRGGSNKYMIDFAKVYPDAKKIVLKENFRSTKRIVDASQRLIQTNTNRLDKNILAVREKGIVPKILPTMDVTSVEDAVNEALQGGLSYGEIAVIASKNKTLDDLAKAVPFPKVMGRELLVENAFFQLMFELLRYGYSGNDEYLLRVLRLLGEEPPKLEDRETLTDAVKRQCQGRQIWAVRIAQLCKETHFTPMKLLFDLTRFLKMNDTLAEEAVEKLISEKHIKTCKKLLGVMQFMVDFGDETRIETDSADAVTFITSHESKGKEWKSVILVDDFKDDRSEETTNLYYVAMTRAMDRLYVLTDKQSSVYEALMEVPA